MARNKICGALTLVVLSQDNEAEQKMLRLIHFTTQNWVKNWMKNGEVVLAIALGTASNTSPISIFNFAEVTLQVFKFLPRLH